MLFLHCMNEISYKIIDLETHDASNQYSKNSSFFKCVILVSNRTESILDQYIFKNCCFLDLSLNNTVHYQKLSNSNVFILGLRQGLISIELTISQLIKRMPDAFKFTVALNDQYTKVDHETTEQQISFFSEVRTCIKRCNSKLIELIKDKYTLDTLYIFDSVSTNSSVDAIKLWGMSEEKVGAFRFINIQMPTDQSIENQLIQMFYKKFSSDERPLVGVTLPLLYLGDLSIQDLPNVQWLEHTTTKSKHSKGATNSGFIF